MSTSTAKNILMIYQRTMFHHPFVYNKCFETLEVHHTQENVISKVPNAKFLAEYILHPTLLLHPKMYSDVLRNSLPKTHSEHGDTR